MLRRFAIPAAILISGFASVADEEVTPNPKLLQNGLPARRLGGHAGDSILFKLQVPPDVEKLTFRTKGGEGDVDLYVRHNAHPTLLRSDDSSPTPGNEERVEIRNPGAGPWYVLVHSRAEFHGVQLRAEYQLQKGAVAIPKVLPPPGFFSGAAVVRLKCSTKGAVIRYTTNGSEPTAASPRYTGRLKLARATLLRARAFARNGRASAEAEGFYQIHPRGEVHPLTNGQPLHHCAGKAGSEQLFQLTVPSGEKLLRIFSEGGGGDTELLIRLGAPPTRQLFHHRVNERGNTAFLEIPNPAAGEWFVLLRGRRAFSGVSITAVARPNLPDLVIWKPAIQPHLSVETFSEEDCEVLEGMIAAGTHTLLRFTTQTRNIGGADLVLPRPGDSDDFDFQECHGHYHFKGFASYRLLGETGELVAPGNKVSFCLLDLERWDPHAAPRRRFTCSRQGIQSGWADFYDSGLPGQWINVSGVPDGRYTLEITMNPDRTLGEADYENNVVSIDVVIDSSDL